MRLKLLLLLLLMALFAFSAGEVWLPIQPKGIVEVHIPAGISSREIGQRLQHVGVIRSSLVFRLLSKISGMSASLQSGYYRFESAANLWQVLERMNNGDAIFYRVTVPEGLRTDEVLALLAMKTGTKEFVWSIALHKILGNANTEGRLLPETYTYRKPIQPGAILASMARGQNAIIKKISSDWLNAQGLHAKGLNAKEPDANSLRIVASIMERETAVNRERPWVAAVIRNRLEKHMALQMDSTVIYGLWREDGIFSGKLHKVDMKRDTPWNTYVHKGLPPTPICNPGKASLLAAAHPADVGYLYFVADGSGGHAFANTLAEHEKNVRRWINLERRR